MKKQNQFLIAVVFCLISTATFAQAKDNRPQLYASLPNTISVQENLMSSLITEDVGKDISIPFSTDFTFAGTVINNVTKYKSMRTIMVKSNTNSASIFQLTQVKLSNDDVAYKGRILNPDAADGFEIKNNNGDYFLQKFETAKILQPCK